MLFEGKLIAPSKKNDRYWGVEVSMLHVHTQGTSRRNAIEMAKDAIESLAEAEGFSFKVSVRDISDDYFAVEASKPEEFIAFMLKRQRQFRNLTVREVAARMKSKSPNAYAQYERGKVRPSLEKLVQLMKAIDPDFEPILKAG